MFRRPVQFAGLSYVQHLPEREVPYYRPQTKFAKVVFSQVSVCSRGGGVCLWSGGVAYTPPRQTPLPWADTPLGRHLPGKHPLPGRHHPANGQQAGGTHPTGMHPCLICNGGSRISQTAGGANP